MPDEPVPITPTRLPLKSTPWCGQAPVWSTWPPKLSTPAIVGTLVLDKQPTALIRKRHVVCVPPLVATVQLLVASSNWAPSTRVLNVMSPRRSKRSATCWA
jgi:hypothetical protein